MKLAQFEAMLKKLDKWGCEARAASKDMPDLDGKLRMTRLQNALQDVRSKLRVVYFEAEDLHKHQQARCHECPRCHETCDCEASEVLVKGACSHDC
jgi:hypothetical protein